MKLKCIVIDDDLHAIKAIKSYIANMSNLILLKDYSDPLQAMSEIIANENVDLIFMDINMPMISGIELAKAVRHKTKILIFTTSHTKYAYEAFEIRANAYLTKPYTFAKFAETITRIFPEEVQSVITKTEKTEDYFFVRNKNEKNNLTKVNYNEIIIVESLLNYVRIHTRKESIIAYISLSEIKEIFKEIPYFMQVHRSFIISKNYLEKVEGNTLKMSNGLSINIGNNFKDQVQHYIKEKTLKSGRQ